MGTNDPNAPTPPDPRLAGGGTPEGERSTPDLAGGDTPEGGPPAEVGDPTDSVDPTNPPTDSALGDTTAVVDVSGQTAPAPDTVGVSEGQGFRPGEDTVEDSPLAGNISGTPAPPPPAADAEEHELPAWAANETADPTTLRLYELGTPPDRPEEPALDTTLPEGHEAVTEGDYVYVSPTDPVLGAQVMRHLERRAARDARLTPLLDRMHLMDNVVLRFDKNDPVLARVEEPAA